MNRRKARKTVLELIFSSQFLTEESARDILDERIKNGMSVDEYVEEVFLGVSDKAEQIDAVITKYLQGWSFERLSKISIAILRLAVYEILYTEIPDSVSANEAVELAKEYAEEKASTFINGVLAKVIGEKNQ
jgi:N utilization substance protein B